MYDREVLVVAENDGLRDLLWRIIGDELTVRTVMTNDGGDALGQIGRKKPAVVVVDLTLPGQGGIELIERVKGDETTSAIPVIALTAPSKGCAEADQAGCDACLVKPLDLSALIGKVAQYLPDPVPARTLFARLLRP